MVDKSKIVGLKLKDIPSIPEGVPADLRKALVSMREHVQAISGTRGTSPVDGRAGGGSTTIVIGGPGSGGTTPPEPDLTPPPDVTSFHATAGFGTIFIEFDAPVYTQGGGNAFTLIYGVKRSAGDPSNVTFPGEQAIVATVDGIQNFYALSTELGVAWHLWAAHVTKAGRRSINIVGGASGVIAQTGLIGGADLAPLLIDATKLAEGAVDLGSNKIKSADKFGAIAVGYTVTQYLLAMNGVMQNLVVDSAQIGSLDVAKLNGGVLKVGGYIQSSNYTAGANGQGYRIARDGIELPATSIRGLLTAPQINGNGLRINSPDGSTAIVDPSAAKPIDNSVINPAAGWMNSNVGLPRGQALNANPECSLGSAWIGRSQAIEFVTNVAGVPNGTAVGNVAGTGNGEIVCSETVPYSPSRKYRVSAKVFSSHNASGICYLGVIWVRPGGVEVRSNGVIGMEGVTAANAGNNPAGWNNGSYSYFGIVGQSPSLGATTYTNDFGASGASVPADVIGMKIVLLPNYNTLSPVARHYLTDARFEDITDVANAQSTATAAATAASTAGTNATSALNRLAAIDSDGILSRGEKPEIIKAWNAVTGESGGIDSQAGSLGITTERSAYVAAYYALSSYLSGLSPSYADTSQDTTIIPANDRAAWNNYYSARQTVLNAIAAKAATMATWDGTSGGNKPLDNAGKVIDLGNGTGAGQRDKDDPPNWAGYVMGKTYQFKAAGALGITGGDSYCTLETIIQYGSPTDGTGGLSIQYAYQGLRTFRRTALRTASSWGEWIQDLDRNAYTGHLDATKGAPSGTFVGGTLAEVVRDGAANGSSAYSAIVDSSTGLNSRLLNGANNVLQYGSRIIAGNLSLSGSGAYQGGYGVAMTQGGIVGVRNGGFLTFSLDAGTGNAVFGGELSAAYGTLGSLTIANGGFVRAGQSAWATGTGFFMGLDGNGNPSFSVGNSLAYLRWSSQTGLELKQDTFTVVGSNNGVYNFTGNGTRSLGSISAVVTGGIGPYTYVWAISIENSPIGPSAATVSLGSGANSATVSPTITSNSGSQAPFSSYLNISVTVTDSTGRVAVGVGSPTVKWNGGEQ